MEQSATRYSVQLYIYDLSRGMARSLSPIMLGESRRCRPACSEGDRTLITDAGETDLVYHTEKNSCMESRFNQASYGIKPPTLSFKYIVFIRSRSSLNIHDKECIIRSLHHVTFACHRSSQRLGHRINCCLILTLRLVLFLCHRKTAGRDLVRAFFCHLFFITFTFDKS